MALRKEDLDMLNGMRTVFAPASIVICVTMIALLFTRLYGTTSEPPAIINPRFKYWTTDPAWNVMKPLMWEISHLIGPNDCAFIRRDIVGDRSCLGLHVYQDGANDAHPWATVHVRQNLGGRATRQLFEGTLELWVYPTFPHARYFDSGHPQNVFGVEINDGTNILWIVFSDQTNETYQIKRHRIVIISTPLNQWSHREVRIGKYYLEAGWQRPSEVALILLVGATRDFRGQYAGFCLEIRVK